MSNPISGNKRSYEEFQIPLDPEKQKQGPLKISDFPNEVIFRIFYYLSGEVLPQSLGRACMVCKLWKQIAYADSLWESFSWIIQRKNCNDYTKEDDARSAKLVSSGVHLSRFLKEDWQNFLKYPIADQMSLPPKNIIPLINRFRKIAPDGFVTLMTIPKKFNYAMLDHHRYGVMPQLTYLTNNPLLFSVSSQRHFEHVRINFLNAHAEGNAMNNYRIQNEDIDKTITILISNKILEGSKNKTLAEQLQMVKELGCEMPSPLIATTLCFLHARQDSDGVGWMPLLSPPPAPANDDIEALEQELLGTQPIYTRCTSPSQEWGIIVGGSARNTHQQPPWAFSMKYFDPNTRSEQIGVLPMMVLPSEK